MAAAVGACANPALASGPSAADAKKGSGSKFFNLRYDEDFRYFDDDREAYESDWRNKFKNIPIGSDWRLDIGGEFRFRLDARSNAFFGLESHSQNTQQHYRWMLHANLRQGDLFRVFVQGIFAHVEDRDGTFLPTQENHGDLQQLFFDLRIFGEDIPLTLRVGRQELDYGYSRWVGPLEWTSNRRRFDAVKLFYEGESWNIDAFYAKPVVVSRKQRDQFDSDVDFYGLYTSYKGIPNHGLDFYFFAIDDTGDRTNPNGNSGDRDIYTLGARFSGKIGEIQHNHGSDEGDGEQSEGDDATAESCTVCGWGIFDYNTELAGQWGHSAGDTIQAWSWNIDLGYTFDHPWRPRLGMGFDLTTGDGNPNDSRVETFDQLFPFNNVCLGYLDLIGRQNMVMTYVGLDAWPVENKIKTSLTFHSFWLHESEDFLYTAGGGGFLRDASGRGGREVGQEIDISLEWIIDEYSSVWLAYAHFFHGPYVSDVVDGADQPSIFLVQYQYRF
jgi:hypothetical protein